MKLRVQNNAKGERGIYVGKELQFVTAGQTRIFEDAEKPEINAVSSHKDFRSWQSENGADWEEITEAQAERDMKPFLAVAMGAKGENVRFIPLEPGEWYLGTAIATDRPDGPQGYEWAKVGAVQAVAAAVTEGLDDEPVVVTPEGSVTAVTEYTFNAAEVVDGNAPQVIAQLKGKTAEQLADILEAEKAGKDRAGVKTAIEAAIEELGNDPFAG